MIVNTVVSAYIVAVGPSENANISGVTEDQSGDNNLCNKTSVFAQTGHRLTFWEN